MIVRNGKLIPLYMARELGKEHVNTYFTVSYTASIYTALNIDEF